jgi:hypothetical protein
MEDENANKNEVSTTPRKKGVFVSLLIFFLVCLILYFPFSYHSAYRTWLKLSSNDSNESKDDSKDDSKDEDEGVRHDSTLVEISESEYPEVGLHRTALLTKNLDAEQTIKIYNKDAFPSVFAYVAYFFTTGKKNLPDSGYIVAGGARYELQPRPVTRGSGRVGFGGGCFARGTLCRMNDGALKCIEEVMVGDIIEAGGRVVGSMQMDGQFALMYDIHGVKISGDHAVKVSRGKWVRAADHPASVRRHRQERILYNLITERHKINIHATQIVECADYEETDDSPADSRRFLHILNRTS